MVIMENLSPRQQRRIFQYLKTYFVNIFIKFILTILIASLNDMFFLACMVINLSGLCSFFRLSGEMMAFYCFLLVIEDICAGYLLYFDVIHSKYFIVDEKKYFVWTFSLIFCLFNFYQIYFVCKSKIFIEKLLKRRNQDPLVTN